MPGIASDFEERFRAGAEQQIVDDLLILLGQGHQLMREREDSMRERVDSAGYSRRRWRCARKTRRSARRWRRSLKER